MWIREGAGLPTQIQSLFWCYIAEACYEPEFLLESAHELPRTPMSYVRASCPQHPSMLIPHFACPYSIDSPSSKQPNAPTPPWCELKQANKKKLDFSLRENVILHGLPWYSQSLHHAQMQRAKNIRWTLEIWRAFHFSFPASWQMPCQSAIFLPHLSIISSLSDL